MIAGSAKEKLGYPAPAGARSFYRTSTDDFEQLALKMAAATRSDPKATFDTPRMHRRKTPEGAAPRPKMRIRLRPLVDNDPRAETADLPGSSSSVLHDPA
jgi:hypothetical protein